MSLTDCTKNLAYWLEVVESMGELAPELGRQLQGVLGQLVACISVRESCSTEEALDLIKNDYAVSRVRQLLNS